MKEGYDVGEIGLMIAYEQNFTPGEVTKVLSSADPDLINDRNPGVGKKSDEKIDDLPNGVKILKPVDQ